MKPLLSILLAIAIAALPLSADAAGIAFDNSTFQTTPTSTLSFSYTNSGNYMFVYVNTNWNGTAQPDVTYNGTALTIISATGFPTGSGQFSYFYELFSPATGTHTLTITCHALSGSVTRGLVETLSGVGGTTHDDAQASSGTSNTASVSLTTIGTADWLLLLGGMGGGGAPVGNAGSSVRTSDSADAIGLGDTNGPVIAGSNSISFKTGDSASHSWNGWAVALQGSAVPSKFAPWQFFPF